MQCKTQISDSLIFRSESMFARITFATHNYLPNELVSSSENTAIHRRNVTFIKGNRTN